MSKRLMMCLSMMLIGCAMSGCGNKGELFLSTDVQLAQELETVSNRIGEGAPSADGTEASANDDVTTTDTDAEQPTADDSDKEKPAKNP